MAICARGAEDLRSAQQKMPHSERCYTIVADLFLSCFSSVSLYYVHVEA